MAGTSSISELVDSARALIESAYAVTVDDITHLATHSNVLCRIDLADGRRLVLRISQPLSNTRSNIDIEVEWLTHLGDDPHLLIPAPIPAANGDLVTEFELDSEVRTCVLFSWVPGEPIGEGAGPSGYRAMGRIAALLHTHGAWRPSSPQDLRRWDRTFYYPDELDPVVLDDFSYDHLFDDRRYVLKSVARRCDDKIAEAWDRGTPMVVHGDLHEWNVHLHLGRAWAFDFEDVMLALPSQDIATSLYGARARDDLDGLIEAFRAGYEEHLRWPVRDIGELETYWAARQVMLMNHAAQILPEPETRDYFGRVMPWLSGYADRAR